MGYKLDLLDCKILNQLDLNCRQSDSQIAKKVRASKQVVNYRIKKLLNEKMITFFTHINLAKLGYSGHKVYIKFKALPKEKEQEMIHYLSTSPTCVWFILCSGKWDLIWAIASKTSEELEAVLTDFMNKYSEFVLNRDFSIFNRATMHHRMWFLKEKQRPVYWMLGGKVENIRIDEIDKKILRSLIKNARMPIIDIALLAGISSSLAIQRIKRLLKEGVIESFRIWVDREKFGRTFCKAIIYYQNKTTEREKKLLEYCYDIPGMLGVSQAIGPWDLELEIEVQSYNEFHSIMKEMKNKFDLIANFDTVYIEHEHNVSYLPHNF